MNYIETVKQELDFILMGEDYADLLEMYALLVLIKGASCTNEDVHDAWSVWQNKTMPEHKSLKPFDELTKEVQDLDSEYRDVIIHVANLLDL